MNKINVIYVMLSSKNVLFSVGYAFLSKKIATFKKLYETGINKLFFSSEEKFWKRKGVRGRRTCACWDKFLDNEVMDSD